MKYNRKTTFL